MRRQGLEQAAASSTSDAKRDEELLLHRLLRERAREQRDGRDAWEKAQRKKHAATAAQHATAESRAVREAQVQQM